MSRRLPVVVLLLSLLTLAWPAAAGEEEPPAAGRTGAAIDAVRARHELRWGADSQGGAPYVFQDPMDPNHLVGFEVDLALALAQRLAVRARPVQGGWDNLFDLLGRGDFDVVINGIEVAEEKKRVCELSRPYYVASERITVRRGDAGAPRTLEALRGRRVGTLPGTLASRILERAGAEVKTYEGGQNEIYEDLRLGRTDAVLLDDPITLYYGAIDPALEVAPGSFGEVEYAVAMRRGDVATTGAVNAALGELATDGTLARIYARWGLWNEATAKLLGGPRPDAGATSEAYDAWRAAVGKPLPFARRVVERYPQTLLLFARGAAMTLAVSLASMALAIVLGVALALARVYGPRPLRYLAVGYIELFRGTPLLIQLTVVYFGLPEVGVTLHPFAAGVLALGLNYASAEAENYRAGLASVSAGQLDAARALGLTTPQALRWVVGPQAFRVAVPPATNDFIALLKDSSLISVVTLTELTKTYASLAAAMRDHLGLGALVALFYLALSLPFARLSRWVEGRLGQHLRRVA
jgi:polar amino acid transport system substrate-binding protein